MSDSRTKCERCGTEETDKEPLFELKIELTGEYWMLCDPCTDDFTDWVETSE